MNKPTFVSKVYKINIYEQKLDVDPQRDGDASPKKNSLKRKLQIKFWRFHAVVVPLKTFPFTYYLLL